MARNANHVTDHNELVALLDEQAARFGYTKVSGGPFNENDPAHIDQHNLMVTDLQGLAALAGQSFTTELPPVANRGDAGHPKDHDAIRDALAEAAEWAAWNAATGGLPQSIGDYNGSGQRWMVHSFPLSDTFTVTVGVQPFQVLCAAGGGGGAGQIGNNAQGGVGGGGGSGGVLEEVVTLPPGEYEVVVGGGGSGGSGGHGAKGGDSYISSAGGDVIRTIGGGNGSGSTSGSGGNGGSGGGGCSHVGNWGGPSGGGRGTLGQGTNGSDGGGQGHGGGGGYAGDGTSTTYSTSARATNIRGSAETVSPGIGGNGGRGRDWSRPGDAGSAGIVVIAYRIS